MYDVDDDMFVTLHLATLVTSTINKHERRRTTQSVRGVTPRKCSLYSTTGTAKSNSFSKSRCHFFGRKSEFMVLAVCNLGNNM